MWIYVWDSEIKGIYLWDTPVKEVYLWDDKIRPTILPNWLCFTANTAWSTVKLNKVYTPTEVTLETSTDWNTRTTYSMWSTITLSSIWDKVYFRNTSETDTWFSVSTGWYYKFAMTWSIAWSGDVTYLLNKNGTDTLSDYCFISLFQGCPLTTTPELPATNLAYRCYNGMFKWCPLTTPPELPATTMFGECYGNMFRWCPLTTPPELPATTLANGCYYQMFYQCTSLEALPKLPATSLPNNCYNAMFHSCSKIKLSTTKTWGYQTAYRIPTSWTGTTGTNSLANMFYKTWWTRKGTPSANTTYYTSNTVV